MWGQVKCEFNPFSNNKITIKPKSQEEKVELCTLKSYESLKCFHFYWYILQSNFLVIVPSAIPYLSSSCLPPLLFKPVMPPAFLHIGLHCAAWQNWVRVWLANLWLPCPFFSFHWLSFMRLCGLFSASTVHHPFLNSISVGEENTRRKRKFLCACSSLHQDAAVSIERQSFLSSPPQCTAEPDIMCKQRQDFACMIAASPSWSRDELQRSRLSGKPEIWLAANLATRRPLLLMLHEVTSLVCFSERAACAEIFSPWRV